MKYILFLSILLTSTAILAGSGMGGGTPPALADLTTELMQAEPGRAGLFEDRTGDIGLLAKTDLLPKLTVTKLQTRSIEAGNLLISDLDFSQLRDRTKALGVVSVEGRAASYNIEAGDTLDSVILQNRREAAREAIRQ